MKTFITLSLFVITPLSAWAQSAAPPHVSAGVQAGVTLSTVSSYRSGPAEEAFGSAFRSGGTAGGFVTIALHGAIAFQPEVLFAQKGATLTDPHGDAGVASTRLTYLEVPLLLRWSPGHGHAAPFVVAGSAVAWTLTARVDSSASGGPSDVDVRNQTRSADVGIVAGGGLQIGRGFVEARLVQGILDIGSTARVDGVVRSRAVSMLAGVRF
jgi:hypothetical protein